MANIYGEPCNFCQEAKYVTNTWKPILPKASISVDHVVCEYARNWKNSNGRQFVVANTSSGNMKWGKFIMKIYFWIGTLEFWILVHICEPYINVWGLKRFRKEFPWGPFEFLFWILIVCILNIVRLRYFNYLEL